MVSKVATKVEEQVASISDPRLARALRRCLVVPRECTLQWDYADRHREFRASEYAGCIVAEFPRSGTGIAYSEYGSGPLWPWVLIVLDDPGYGMDGGWFERLEDAFRESMEWDEPPPPGYEVP